MRRIEVTELTKTAVKIRPTYHPSLGAFKLKANKNREAAQEVTLPFYLKCKVLRYVPFNEILLKRFLLCLIKEFFFHRAYRNNMRFS